MKLRNLLITAVLLFVFAGTADAVTLTTPVGIGTTGTGRILAFVVTNVGTTPSTITKVQCVTMLGTALVGDDGCGTPPATLPSGTSCTLGVGVGLNAYCTVTGSGKLRAALVVLDGANDNALVDTIPATVK